MQKSIRQNPEPIMTDGCPNKTLSNLGTEVNFFNLIMTTKHVQLTAYLMVRNSELSH